jgi:hypothetical protein
MAGRIADGFLDQELGAANADGRRRRRHPVVVRITLAYCARNRPQSTADQCKEPALLFEVELIVVDPEFASRLQGHQRAIAEADLDTSGGAGNECVARLHPAAGGGHQGLWRLTGHRSLQGDFTGNQDQLCVVGVGAAAEAQQEERQQEGR